MEEGIQVQVQAPYIVHDCCVQSRRAEQLGVVLNVQLQLKRLSKSVADLLGKAGPAGVDHLEKMTHDRTVIGC